ncbi:MAG TPA: protein kinase [Planktothrix sp.]|jgi:serine/threonine protein kinase
MSTHSEGAAPIGLQFAPKILEQFDVLDKIGEGGMGQVFRLRERVTGREFAIKVMNQAASNDVRSVQRFDQEAHAVRKLIHANLVSVIDAAAPLNSSPYILMELIDGEDLASVLAKRGALQPRESFQYGMQICGALEHAHGKGVIHRDLKPSNVIITPSGKAKVVDFGISKLVDSRNIDFAATGASELIGSPFYMSPEQCSGESMDARSDIYSFGCMLYEMLSGDPPFVHANPIKMLIAHINEEPAKLTVAHPDDLRFVSVWSVVRKCLEKAPANRYQSASDLSADLKRILDGRSCAATRKTVSTNSLAKVAVVVLGVALLALLGSAIYGCYLLLQPPKDARSMSTLTHPGTSGAGESDGTLLKSIPQEDVPFLTFIDNGRQSTQFFSYSPAAGAATFNEFVDRHPGVTALRLEFFNMSDVGYLAFARLNKLETLSLVRCTSLKNFATAVSHLDKLNSLEISDCELPEGSLKGLENLPLKTLIMHNVKTNGDELYSIAKLHSLKNLDLTGSQISSIGLKTIVQGAPGLTTLTLSDVANIVPDGFGSLASLKHLQKLSLSGDRQVGENMAAICSIDSLQQLDLSATGIRDSDLQRLASLRYLSQFIFSDTPITDAGLDYLAKLKSLKYIGSWNTYVTGAGIAKLAAARPDLMLTSAESNKNVRKFGDLFGR